MPTPQLCPSCAASSPAAPRAPRVPEVLASHFAGQELHELVTQVRVFPLHMRADVQTALDATLGGARVIGVHFRYGGGEQLDFAAVSARSEHHEAEVAPLQSIEVDVGEELPRRCLTQALWLRREGPLPYAVLLSNAGSYGRTSGVRLEVAVAPGEAGAAICARLLDQVEAAVRGARAYRGKVLSLEQEEDYGGRQAGIKVHRLRAVSRDEVVLPARTLELLERNVFEFVARREGLARLGLPLKKGLLFHGPPGTGKTHTIQYLAARLAGHTTLLVTAEQVGLLDEYFALARLLQPAILVVEDADLIARERTNTRAACEEALLNRLLNEMDGLREDAEVLFILTTNRPDALEPALAERPGRIDQAIEFPLPDLEGRRRLIRLYARGLEPEAELVDGIALRTAGASAAFVKELMRRSAQAALGRSRDRLELPDVEEALEEMLFRGGRLNRRLLGGEVEAES